jgi:hypothetical protein
VGGGGFGHRPTPALGGLDALLAAGATCSPTWAQPAAGDRADRFVGMDHQVHRGMECKTSHGEAV